MHIVLTLLGAIVTILYILDRLDIDIGGLNPWSWRRRRAWANRYHADPIYSVEEPMHVAALLVIGAARLEGDLTAEQKQAALDRFEKVFSLDARQATELYGSATHLLAAPQLVDTQLQGVLDRNRDRFTPEQAESMIEIAGHVLASGGEPTDRQRAYLDELRRCYLPAAERGTWA